MRRKRNKPYPMVMVTADKFKEGRKFHVCGAMGLNVRMEGKKKPASLTQSYKCKACYKFVDALGIGAKVLDF